MSLLASVLLSLLMQQPAQGGIEMPAMIRELFKRTIHSELFAENYSQITMRKRYAKTKEWMVTYLKTVSYKNSQQALADVMARYQCIRGDQCTNKKHKKYAMHAYSALRIQ